MNSVLSQIILDVRDLDRSLDFYVRMLGLTVTHQEDCEGNRLAYLNTGGTEILLLQQPECDQDPSMERSGGLVVNFRVHDLPSVSETLDRNEIIVLRRLEMAIWGDRTLLVQDPDGYAVLLSEPVSVSKYR
jgi:catechol-2,3-dioxygenase